MSIYIIVDLEATCWEKGTSPARMETIEIGAVRIATPDYSVVDEFGRFIRPVAEPQLSDFCKELTSISQEDVDGAKSFPEVFDEFLTWAGEEFAYWCSWGAYDSSQLRRDCERHNLPWPGPLDRHLNLKVEFSRRMECRPQGMRGALNKLEIPLVGTHHRGMDDARNIAKLAAFLLPGIEQREGL